MIEINTDIDECKSLLAQWLEKMSTPDMPTIRRTCEILEHPLVSFGKANTCYCQLAEIQRLHKNKKFFE